MIVRELEVLPGFIIGDHNFSNIGYERSRRSKETVSLPKENN